MTEAAPNPDRLLLLARFPSSAEAGMAYEILRNNGIDAILQGASFSGLEPLRLPGGFSEVRLLVPWRHFEEASHLYRAFFGPDSMKGDDLFTLPADGADGNGEGDD